MYGLSHAHFICAAWMNVLVTSEGDIFVGFNVCMCDWMCRGFVCVCVSVYAKPAPKASEGVPQVSPHTVSKPIWAGWQQEHDCPSLWPHAQCQLFSAGLEGMEARKRDLWAIREREPTERQRRKKECMAGWRMRRGSMHTEYKWKREWSDEEVEEHNSRKEIRT